MRPSAGFARTQRGPLVCGWSFGANVALREALSDDRAGAPALIGLPLEPADVEIPPTPGPSEPGPSRVPPCCSRVRGTSTALGRGWSCRRQRCRTPSSSSCLAPTTSCGIARRRSRRRSVRSRFVPWSRRTVSRARAAGSPRLRPTLRITTNGRNRNVNPSSCGTRNTPTSTNTIDSPIHTPGSPPRTFGFECTSSSVGEHERDHRDERARGEQDRREGAHRHPGYGPGNQAVSGEQLAREPDALALEVRDEPGGVKRRLRRVDAGGHAALGQPAHRRRDRDRRPERPRRQPLGRRLEVASDRYVAGAPPELPATRTSITSRSDGSPSAAERRFRTAASASRGTTGPLEVMTGPATRGPAHEEDEPLVDRSRQREPPTHVADPGDRPGKGGRLRVQRVHRRLRADRLGEGPSITPDPASTSRKRPSSNTIAGRVNSSRIVSAE